MLDCEPHRSLVVRKLHFRVVVISGGFCAGIDRQAGGARRVLIYFDGANGRLNLNVVALIVHFQIADEQTSQRQAEEHHHHDTAGDNPQNPPHRVIAAPLRRNRGWWPSRSARHNSPLACYTLIDTQRSVKMFPAWPTAGLVETHFDAWMPVEMHGINEAHFRFLERHDQRVSARSVAEEIYAVQQAAAGNSGAREDD